MRGLKKVVKSGCIEGSEIRCTDDEGMSSYIYGNDI